MSEKYRTVIKFAPSPDVPYDATGEAGYEVLLKINGEKVERPKIKPALGDVRLEIEANIGDQVAGLVFPVSEKGVFGQGRPFNFSVKPDAAPAPVGEPRITNVYPPLKVD